MELRDVRHAHFRESGFMVVRNVLSPEEVATLRRRADEIIQDIDGYQCRDTAKRQRLQERYKQDVPAASRATTFTEMPEERISQRYVRRGDRVYPRGSDPLMTLQWLRRRSPTIRGTTSAARSIISRTTTKYSGNSQRTPTWSRCSASYSRPISSCGLTTCITSRPTTIRDRMGAPTASTRMAFFTSTAGV